MRKIKNIIAHTRFFDSDFLFFTLAIQGFEIYFYQKQTKRTLHNKNDKYCEAQLVKSNKHSYLIP